MAAPLTAQLAPLPGAGRASRRAHQLLPPTVSDISALTPQTTGLQKRARAVGCG